MRPTTRSEIAPATAADFEAVYGHAPKFSFQGYAVRVDGVAHGVGGVYRTNGQHVAFCRITGPVSKKAVVKAGRLILDLIRSRRRVFAIRDPEVPTAPTLLKHLGFEFLTDSPAGEVYLWHG